MEAFIKFKLRCWLADLKTVLPSLVSLAQGAFVHRRQILIGVLTSHCQQTHEIQGKDRNPGWLCKLDLEKANDRVDWRFLQYMLCRMGFGTRWRARIQECIYFAHFLILKNGSPVGFF